VAQDQIGVMALPPTGEQYEAATKAGIDLAGVLDGKIALTADLAQKLAELKINTTYPVFAGFTIHNLYEFFLLFVALPGVACVLLLAISPVLKKMMHGVK